MICPKGKKEIHYDKISPETEWTLAIESPCEHFLAITSRAVPDHFSHADRNTYFLQHIKKLQLAGPVRPSNFNMVENC